jgi:hypothetical protein
MRSSVGDEATQLGVNSGRATSATNIPIVCRIANRRWSFCECVPVNLLSYTANWPCRFSIEPDLQLSHKYRCPRCVGRMACQWAFLFSHVTQVESTRRIFMLSSVMKKLLFHSIGALNLPP